jgi:ribosomal protein L29
MRSMGHLTFADLIARRVPLAASEAAALTLAVARLMDVRRASGQRVRLPDDEWIILSSNGEVSIVEVHGTLGCDETTSLSALLRRLLRLDERRPAGGHEMVPGGLLIVLARNLGYIHLPATEPPAFRAALERFAASDPAVLSAVFWRAASSGRGIRTLRPVTRRSTDNKGCTERRHHGASRADLRRALRNLEQELYELRGQVNATSATAYPTSRAIRRSTIAATLAASFVGALTLAALLVTGGTRERAAAGGPDVVLAPAAAGLRVVPAVAALPDLDAEPGQEQPSSDAAPVRVRRTSSAPAVPEGKQRTEAPRPRAKKPDPLAAHRGGTRGIPW